jgi:hypothetical protein
VTSSAEREFPSDKVYRRDDRGIVGAESFGLQGLAFFGIHTSVGRAAWPDGSSWPSPMLASIEKACHPANAEKGIEAIKTHAPGVTVVDKTG